MARSRAAVAPPRRSTVHKWSAIVLPLALFASACGADEPSYAPLAVRASPHDDMATLVNVEWTTAEQSIGYVSYGKTPSLGETTRLESVAGTKHAQALLGLSADTLYHYRVITWDGHNAGRSEIQTVRTPALPSSIPSLTMDGLTTEDEGFDQLLLVPVTGDATVVTVLAPSGEVLWYHVEASDRSVTRARFSSDGRRVVYNAIDTTDGSDSELVSVALDASEIETISVPGLGRDFVELPDGGFAALATDERDHDGAPLRGDRVVEIDEDGTVTTVWSSWDCFDPADFPGNGSDGEWTGAAALTFDQGASKSDAEDDGYYVSLRNLGTVLRASRETGECAWILGDAAPTIEFADDAPAFTHPGAFLAGASRLLVMDANPTDARVLDYDLDLEAATATLSWDYTPSPAIQVDALGSVTEMTRDRRFVNWSTAGKLELVDEEGDVRWSLEGSDVSFGYEALESPNDGLYLAKGDGS